MQLQLKLLLSPPKALLWAQKPAYWAALAQQRPLVWVLLLLQVLRLAAAGRLAERNGQATLDGHPLFTPLPLESAAT